MYWEDLEPRGRTLYMNYYGQRGSTPHLFRYPHFRVTIYTLGDITFIDGVCLVQEPTSRPRDKRRKEGSSQQDVGRVQGISFE